MSAKASNRIFSTLLFSLAVLGPSALQAQTQPFASTTWTVSIVLPARVIAGKPAMLAVLGVDGRLAAGVTVQVGGQRVTTDDTGRAFFTPPSDGAVLLAKASGASAAAVIDPAPQPGMRRAVSVAPIVSMREPFSICGFDFSADVQASHVRINGEPALVMAASPECLSVLPGAKSTPGPAQISIASAASSGGRWSVSTTLVALDSEIPQARLTPGQKTVLKIRVRGSDRRLRVLLANEVPGVLRFPHGDVQEVGTSGGADNVAQLEVMTVRSGDFSFGAKLMPVPDENLAKTYLLAAVPLAGREVQRGINRMLKELERHPQDFDALRRNIDGLLGDAMAGDFRTVLVAARTALS